MSESNHDAQPRRRAPVEVPRVEGRNLFGDDPTDAPVSDNPYGAPSVSGLNRDATLYDPVTPHSGAGLWTVILVALLCGATSLTTGIPLWLFGLPFSALAWYRAEGERQASKAGAIRGVSPRRVRITWLLAILSMLLNLHFVLWIGAGLLQLLLSPR